MRLKYEHTLEPQWRVRNVPCPIETYLVTADVETHEGVSNTHCVCRTLAVSVESVSTTHSVCRALNACVLGQSQCTVPDRNPPQIHLARHPQKGWLTR